MRLSPCNVQHNNESAKRKNSRNFFKWKSIGCFSDVFVNAQMKR